MNLCLACRDVKADGEGGLPRAMGDLAQALAQDGHRVCLLTNDTDAPPPELPEVSIRRVPIPRTVAPGTDSDPESATRNLMHAAAVYREVRRIHDHEQPVDAVLAPLWRSEGALCALDDRFPTIVSCMTSLKTLTEVDPRYQLLAGLDQRLSLESAALSRSRYLHGLTRSALAKTIADYDLHPDATEVIARGLRDRREPGDTTGRGDGVPRVLFVGRIEHRKGIDTLLGAARQLLDDGLSVSFDLAGRDGDPRVQDSFDLQAVDQPRLREAIRFTGPVSDRELHDLYAACDVVCIPSRYESHGVVLIEAMMFGKPIVTCDAGGICEVIEPGRTALVSPPDQSAPLADSLRRLLGDPALRSGLGRAARESYERRFQVGIVSEQMESFIERVIKLNAERERTAPAEMKERLQGLLQEALDVSRQEAWAFAGDLLDPPSEAWRAVAGQEALQQARSEAARLNEALAAQERKLTFLHGRHQTLVRVEQGGWWRLRGRLLPLLRSAARIRAVVRRGPRDG